MTTIYESYINDGYTLTVAKDHNKWFIAYKTVSGGFEFLGAPFATKRAAVAYLSTINA